MPKTGTYAPTAQASQRMSMALGFEFNLSIQREVTSVVTEFRGSDLAASSSSSARLSALESRSLYYQSVMNESRGRLAGGYTESRSIQTELFYSRTRELSLSLPAGRAEQFDQTRTQVTRSFSLDISMDFSFLGQFSRQLETISSLDDSLFGRYLDNTGGLSEQSSKALQSFFDDMDRILEESESLVVGSLQSFFDQIGEQFGLSTNEADALEAMVMDEVVSFFDDIDSFLSESRLSLAGLAEPAVSSDTSVPDGEGGGEEDPSALLA